MLKQAQLDYMYKTQPYEHQHEVFMASRDKEYYGLLMEQGTGKSKPTIDTAAYLFGQGKIDALLVIAPNGVHRNWVVNEIPTHLPDYIPSRAAFWQSQMKAAQRKQVDSLFERGEFLRVLTMNVEAFSSAKGLEFAIKFMEQFRTMLVVDESSRIKSPQANRTKNILKLKKFSDYRRILTGTMITNSPLDAFTQMNFLDNSILGFGSFYAFKAHYAELKQEVNRKTNQPYTVVTGYKNLDELKSDIAPHTFRVLKRDCLDLPEKIFQRRYVELSDNQRRLYNELKKKMIVEFQGEQMSVTLALTKMLRLQQILGGFYTTDEGETLAIDKECPRMAALMELVEDSSGKFIIWARFKAEIKEIVRLLRKEYGDASTVEYHGDIDNQGRQNAVFDFQNDDRVRFFVGQPRSGGIGLTLTAASSTIYYSNDFSLELRLQSEDRAHRIGQRNPVTYYDLEATDTMDGRIIDALRNKKSIADLITGDSPVNWI